MKRTLGYSTLLLCSFLSLSMPQTAQAQQKVFGIPGTTGGVANVVLDQYGSIYFDDGSARIKKKSIFTGVVTTLAGTGVSGHTGDGGLATSAQINANCRIAVDGNGDLLIAENSSNFLRKVNHVTGIINSIGGTGANTDNGDGGLLSAADIGAPTALCLDVNGNIFIGNIDCIRRVDATTNIITTVTGAHGAPGFTGNGGPAASAKINRCADVIVDAIGDIFFSDANNQQVRKIDVASGKINAFAGNGLVGGTGDGGAATSAKLNSPSGLAFDGHGTVYIATGAKVRKVVTGGIISSVAGTGVLPSVATGLCSDPTTTGMMPFDIALDDDADLYIGDRDNNEILKTSWGLEIKSVDINTLCKPGFSTPPTTPQFTATMKSGVLPYTYAWVAATGNTATLSSSTIANPNVTAVTSVAAYTLTVTDASGCLSSAHRLVKATFNTTASVDLASRDSYYDMFDEPNTQAVVDPTKWDIWSSPDIWNRLKLDHLPSHQDPCYGSPCTNYMYVSYKNVGCTSWAPTVTKFVELYWTIGGYPETWPINWDGTAPFPPNPTLPLGQHVLSDPLSTSMTPGSIVTTGAAWTPPNPQSYYGLSAKEMEICLLARIKDMHNFPTDPEGMTFTEGPGISANVRNNNNIVTRNTRVVYVSYYSPKISWLIVGNSDHNPRNFNLEFSNVRGQLSTMSKYMSITVSLGPVFQNWINNGGKGTYAAIDYQNQTVTFDGTTTMELDDIPFAPDEQDFIMVTFAMLPNSGGWDMNDETVQFRQTDLDENGDLETYGNFTYEVLYDGDGDADPSGGGQGKQPIAAGLNPLFNGAMVNVFPNPVNTTLYVEFAKEQTGNIRITDLTGRTMESKELHGQRTTFFDVRQYPAGTYLYEFFDGKKAYRGKVVVNK